MGTRIKASCDGKNAIPRAVEEKTSAATVRIRRGPDDRGFSGVILSADGLIASCGHHFVAPCKAVAVCLPDGGRSRQGHGHQPGLRRQPRAHPRPGTLASRRAGRFTPDGARRPLPVHRLRPRREPGSTAERAEVVCRGVGHQPMGISPRHRPCDPLGRWGLHGGGIFDADGRLVAIHSASRAGEPEWDQIAAQARAGRGAS